VLLLQQQPVHHTLRLVNQAVARQSNSRTEPAVRLGYAACEDGR
jgi:hypothetical protein